jgi:hypothetical protein
MNDRGVLCRHPSGTIRRRARAAHISSWQGMPPA